MNSVLFISDSSRARYLVLTWRDFIRKLEKERYYGRPGLFKDDFSYFAGTGSVKTQ